MRRIYRIIPVFLLLGACSGKVTETAVDPAGGPLQTAETAASERLRIYAPFTLSADLSGLSDEQRRMLGLLIEASQIMDGLFWRQSFGERDELLGRLESPALRAFAEINYGPWDRLDGNKPFVPGIGPKPAGANFYPRDMSKEEFEAWAEPGKSGLYSLVRRDAAGKLMLVPYREAYAEELARAASLLREAAELASDAQFANYLRLRADAFETDRYQPSDLAWMDMKNNPIDLVIGPIENYEDRLFNYRAAFESYVLIKDLAWSERLSRYAAFLPELQRGLPVPDVYKAEMPGTDSDLNAYDVVYYAGDCNAGAKTIAINLPNDEEVQLQKGTRRLQLKNAMRAKFDEILVPIAQELIAEDQLRHITFDAFFANTMFHEVAHGLGIKNTINGRGTVRHALKELASSIEEGKADILGLYMISSLRAKDEIPDGTLMDNYVTFMAGIFRSVRFGATSAHGRANMVRFNFFREMGAFERDETSGRYRVNAAKFAEAMDALSNLILTLQGNGDYAGALELINGSGVIGAGLQADLERLDAAGIPVDITFRQGREVLGL